MVGRTGGHDLLYGVPKIAEYMGIAERSARYLCDTGVIPTFRVGKKMCASRKDIDDYLADQRAAAAREAKKAGGYV